MIAQHKVKCACTGDISRSWSGILSFLINRYVMEDEVIYYTILTDNKCYKKHLFVSKWHLDCVLTLHTII